MNNPPDSSLPIASYWEAENARDKSVRCLLCPQCCVIVDGHTGFCGARTNRGGVLYADCYGIVSSASLDPIEKKPLYRFHPGSGIFSIGSYGCNLRCAFCQNHSIAAAPSGNFLSTPHSPQQIVDYAASLTQNGNIGIAYTYNEPLIGYEYVMDCAVLAHERGLKNVAVTNGFINPEPLRALLPYLDALNIDLKGFTDGFYEKLSGRLDPVKESIATAAQSAHVEVSALIIPGENDLDAEMDGMAAFLAGISKDIPLHIARFFPRHRMTDKQPTSREAILRLKYIAEKHLVYVYAGNF